MREYTKKPESQSRSLESNPKASRQAPIDVILQAYKNGTLGKCESIENEELLQAKTSRQTPTSIIFQQPIVQLQGVKINNSIEHEAEAMGESASSKQYLTQTQLKKTSHESVIQRKEVNVRITGITHLVQKQEDQEDSIMDGAEYQEVSSPTILYIDDEKVINSNRGPNQELFEHIDRLQNEKIYQWFQVKSIAGNKLSNNQIYVRGGTFQSISKEGQDFIRHEKARKRGQNQVLIYLIDDWYEGCISEYKKEPVKYMKVLSSLNENEEVKVCPIHGDVKVGNEIKRRGEKMKIIEVFNKEFIFYKIYDVTYQGDPQPSEDGQWVEPKYIIPLSFISQRPSADIIHYHPPLEKPYGAEYVKPRGEIDITSHAIGSGIYGFHPDSEKPFIPYNVVASIVTIDNPLIIQDKGHGECFKTFSKELAKLTKDIYAKIKISGSKNVMSEIMETGEYKEKRNILFVKLKWLLIRAGHRPPEISAIDQAIISFLKLYTEQSDYVEQVSTILFSNLGFGGIYGNPETGLSSMSTGNIKFIAHDDKGYKRRIRDGKDHVFVDGSQF